METVGIKKINKMETELKNVNIRLKNLHSDIVALNGALKSFIMGDGTSAYWNGEDAKVWFDKAIKNHNNNIADYKAAYNYAVNMDTQLASAKAVSKKKSKKH